MEPLIEEMLQTDEAVRFFLRHGVRLAFLFGSQARGTATAQSDLDLGLVFGVYSGPIDRLDRASTIGRELGTLLGKSVDAVVLDDARPVLCYEAVIRGVTVFAVDPEEALRYELRTRARYEDYAQIQRHYTAEMRERLGLPV